MIDDAVHVAVVEALASAHRRETDELRALNVCYRALLGAAGIAAPTDEHGAEALRRYRAAFIAAGDGDLEQPRELTGDWWGGKALCEPRPDLPVPEVWPVGRVV